MGPRFLLYLIVFKLGLASMFEIIRSQGLAKAMAETGAVEMAQLAALAMTSILLFSVGRRTSSIGLIFLAALPVCAIVRELDSTFDALIPVLTWKLPFGILALGLAVLALRRRRELARSLSEVFSSRGGAILFCGFLVVFAISRLAGQQAVWRDVLGDAYQYKIARMIEETVELAGYLMLLLGAAETGIERTSTGRSSRGAASTP